MEMTNRFSNELEVEHFSLPSFGNIPDPWAKEKISQHNPAYLKFEGDFLQMKPITKEPEKTYAGAWLQKIPPHAVGNQVLISGRKPLRNSVWTDADLDRYLGLKTEPPQAHARQPDTLQLQVQSLKKDMVEMKKEMHVMNRCVCVLGKLLTKERTLRMRLERSVAEGTESGVISFEKEKAPAVSRMLYLQHLYEQPYIATLIICGIISGLEIMAFNSSNATVRTINIFYWMPCNLILVLVFFPGSITDAICALILMFMLHSLGHITFIYESLVTMFVVLLVDFCFLYFMRSRGSHSYSCAALIIAGCLYGSIAYYKIERGQVHEPLPGLELIGLGFLSACYKFIWAADMIFTGRRQMPIVQMIIFVKITFNDAWHLPLVSDACSNDEEFMPLVSDGCSNDEYCIDPRAPLIPCAKNLCYGIDAPFVRKCTTHPRPAARSAATSPPHLLNFIHSSPGE